jgi:hypothetical protein
MIIKTSIVTCFLVTSAGTAAAVSLDELISFDDPYNCVPSDDFGALLGGVIAWEESGDTYVGTLASPPAPPEFGDQLGRPELVIEGTEYRASVPLFGEWRGLVLHSLVIVAWVESEGGFYVVFDAAPEQVQEAANRAGFDIPVSGSEYRDLGAIGVTVGVGEYNDLAALYCILG